MPRRRKSTEKEASYRSEDRDDDLSTDEDDGDEFHPEGGTHDGYHDDSDDADSWESSEYQEPQQQSQRSSRPPQSQRSSRPPPSSTPPPADFFTPGDIITITVGKSDPRQDAGLKVEARVNKKFYVRKVPSGGLFARTPIRAGDKILELNGIDSKKFKKVNELKKVLKDEPRITVVVARKDPYASDSSESSFDSDEDEDEDEYKNEINDDVEDVNDGVSELTFQPKKGKRRSSGRNPVQKDSFSLRNK